MAGSSRSGGAPKFAVLVPAGLIATICLVAVALVVPSTTPAATGAAVAQVPEPTHLVGAYDTELLSATLPRPVFTVAAPAAVEPVTRARITAAISGASAGEVVVLEERDEDVWTAIGSSRLAADGTATTSVAQTEPATYTYRLRLFATTKHRAAASENIAMAVGSVEPSATPSTPEPTALPSPSDTASVAATDSATETSTAAPSETSTPAGRPAPPEPPSPTLCGGEAPQTDGGRPWVCVYDDEFDGSALDRRYWVPQKSAGSGFYTGTPDRPACVLDDPRTIGVQDGRLDLKAIVLEAPVACGKKSSALASGSVTHRGTFSQTYGRYEVRAKLPDWRGKGLQETLWLWPNDAFKYGTEHPASGEIDFGEFYSNYADLNVPVMHYVFDPATINFVTMTNIYTSHYCTIRYGEWNTYGLEWVPGRMKIFINGQLCITNNYVAFNVPADKPYAPFDSPFFLSLTQLFGTTGNEFDPATAPPSATSVDYVRIWA